jgi:hypothetical protein
MRKILVRFILLFAVVGESSLVVLAVTHHDARDIAECSIAGIGSTAATLDATRGTLGVTPAACDGFLQQASAVDLLRVTRP